MKKLIYSASSLVLLTTSCLLAQDKAAETAKPLEAKLVTTIVCSGLPKEIDFMNQPNNYKEGTALTFFLQGENFVSFDKKSMKADGWKMGFFNKVSKDGKTATLNISNKNITKIEDIKLNGTIEILVANKTETKTAILKKGVKIEFPAFTAELEAGEGVKIIGDYASIKSITTKTDGKVEKSNGSSWSGKEKTFDFRSIKEGSEVTIVYYTDIRKQIVKFSK